MGILDWLKNATRGAGLKSDFIAGQGLHFGHSEEAFQGLNMKEAIDAHTTWTRHIEQHINNGDVDVFSIARASADHNCELGKWLHGEAKKQFGTMPEYHELCKAHTDFHLYVGNVLIEVFNDNKISAERGTKDIRRQSGIVQLALIRFYAAVTQS